MKIIVGLGNPGKDYENTRHNVGYMVCDELQKEITKLNKQITNKSKIRIFKSQNFMNESGEYVRKQTNAYHLLPSDLYIIHDDLDLPLGSYKIQFSKGPKDHNGITSIDEALGTKDYWHVRVGIDNRPMDNRTIGEEYVLQELLDNEREIIDKVIKEIVKKLILQINQKKTDILDKSEEFG